MFGARWQAADGGVLQSDSSHRSKYSFKIIWVSVVIAFFFLSSAFFVRGPSLTALASLSLQSKKQIQLFTYLHSRRLQSLATFVHSHQALSCAQALISCKEMLNPGLAYIKSAGS